MPLPLIEISIKPSDLKKPSVMILIAANIVPVIGALFLGWKIFPILLLFWIENVIVGIFNVLKMLLSAADKTAAQAHKIATIIFFCIHYGMFTLVHGVFVIVVFGFQKDNPLDLSALPQFFRDTQLIWGILSLVISHGASFVVNYIGKREYKHTNVNDLMMQPYERVVILHLTIIFGAFMVTLLGSPIFGLLILIVLKVIIDIIAHLKQHTSMT